MSKRPRSGRSTPTDDGENLVYSASSRSRARARRRELVQAAPLFARLDWMMLLAVAGIVAYGLWVISGITRDDVPGDSTYYVYRQFVFVALGVLALVIGIVIDPDLYRRFQKHIYLGTLILFAIVFLSGAVARGSRRWIDLAFFRFQPSEFGKLLVVLALAGFLADRYRRLDDPRTVLATIGLAVPPIVLVFIQPDIGSALVYVAALGALLFVAGTRWPHLVVVWAVTALAIVTVLWLLPLAWTVTRPCPLRNSHSTVTIASAVTAQTTTRCGRGCPRRTGGRRGRRRRRARSRCRAG